MLEAINQYVEREEAQTPFKQEALASRTAYIDTGPHSNGDEVRIRFSICGR